MAALAPNRLLFLLTIGLMLAGGAWLRIAWIDRRPFHADEAVQAYQTWQLLRGDGYTYDPADKHGPYLYYAATEMARLAGWTPATLDESRLRTVPLIAGLLTLALCAAMAARLGKIPTVVATATLALAPLAVIYDTYFVQEAWFSLFTWALFFAVLRLVEKPDLSRALIVGLLAGLMQATKETSVLHFAALGAVVLALRSPREILRLWPRLLTALGAGVFVYVLFYSAFFTHWAGVADGVSGYFVYAGRAASSAHDQPWYYYLLLLWPHTAGGILWGEPVLLGLAGLGAVTGFFSSATQTHRALAVFTGAMLLIYSVIPYKTPWLLLTPYIGLALLAGVGVKAFARWWPRWPGYGLAALLALGLLTGEARLAQPALNRYASDERNPYLYEPTSPQFPRLLVRLQELTQEAGRPLRIAVASPDHAWPLPWYLRSNATTGYFSVQPQAAAFDVVLLDSRLAETTTTTAGSPFGLRPNVLLWLNRPPAPRQP